VQSHANDIWEEEATTILISIGKTNDQPSGEQNLKFRRCHYQHVGGANVVRTTFMEVNLTVWEEPSLSILPSILWREFRGVEGWWNGCGGRLKISSM